MHQAVFGCLVECGKAFYTIFLSYRSLSEAPLAHLFFDILNHRQCYNSQLHVFGLMILARPQRHAERESRDCVLGPTEDDCWR